MSRPHKRRGDAAKKRQQRFGRQRDSSNSSQMASATTSRSASWRPHRVLLLVALAVGTLIVSSHEQVDTGARAQRTVQQSNRANVVETPGQAWLPTADGQSIGFTGYRKDEATGLYYANARWYDPLVGGFNAMDPAFGKTGSPITFNKYLYANANPTFYVDPDGREGWNAQLGRLNELAYTNNPVREAQLREQIRIEGIRESARVGATMAYAQRAVEGAAEFGRDMAHAAVESLPIAQAMDIDLGGAAALSERGQALANVMAHPIDNNLITPIIENRRRAAALEAQHRTFEAEYADHEATLGMVDAAGLVTGVGGAGRSLTWGTRGPSAPRPAATVDAPQSLHGPSTSPVYSNLLEQAARGGVVVEAADGGIGLVARVSPICGSGGPCTVYEIPAEELIAGKPYIGKTRRAIPERMADKDHRQKTPTGQPPRAEPLAENLTPDEAAGLETLLAHEKGLGNLSNAIPPLNPNLPKNAARIEAGRRLLEKARSGSGGQ